MVYTDTLFLIFFAFIAVASTALKPHSRAREWLLIGVSLFIVASWGIFDVVLFVGIAVVNFFAAHAIVRLAGRTRQMFLLVMIAADIAALALFKYSNFVGGNIAAATGWPTPQLALGIPLAISFYTFHIISYLVDVHRKVVPEAGFRHYIFLQIEPNDLQSLDGGHLNAVSRDVATRRLIDRLSDPAAR